MSMTARTLRWTSLAVLGGLGGWHVGGYAGFAITAAVAGLVAGSVGIVVLGVLLRRGHRATMGDRAGAVVGHAIDSGFLMLMPYAVLALLCDFVLGWESVQAFVGAGLATAAVVSASEIAARGGRRLYSQLVGTGWMVVLGMAWVWFLAEAARALRP